jgi:hypothetical protein
MKRLLFATLALTMLGCEKDETQDCGCDRVISTNYTIVQTIPQSGPPVLVTIGTFTTRDKCGNENTWYVEQYGIPNIGDCK